MSDSYSYYFDNLSRIGLDSCSKTQEDLQNVSFCNYMTQNYFQSDCTMQKPFDVALSNPGVVLNGGYGSGAGGCNIDNSSKLLIGTVQTHPRCHIDLYQRPFATVPYLGRGSVNPVLEAQILQGEQVIDKRHSVNPLAEKSYLKYSHTPLLSDIQQIHQSRRFESEIDPNWSRGGVDTKQYGKNGYK